MRQYRHGLSTMKRALAQLGSLRLDMRFGVNKALAQWRMDLIQDLGGEHGIRTQEEAIVEQGVRSKLILDSVRFLYI